MTHIAGPRGRLRHDAAGKPVHRADGHYAWRGHLQDDAPHAYALSEGAIPAPRRTAWSRGVDGRIRAAEKLELTLEWLLAWGVATPGLLNEALNIHGSRWLLKLEKAGLVRRVLAPEVSGRRLVMLTEYGQSRAALNLPHLSGTALLDESEIDRTRLLHLLASQAYVIALTRLREDHEQPPVVALEPERAGHAWRASGEKVPDVRLWLEGVDGPVAVEIELTAKKAGRERDKSLGDAARLIEAGEVAQVIYVSPSASLLRLYEQTLAMPLARWRRSKDGKRWEREPQDHVVVKGVRAAFEWVHAPQLLSRFIHGPMIDHGPLDAPGGRMGTDMPERSDEEGQP